jgi:hypothetical protein
MEEKDYDDQNKNTEGYQRNVINDSESNMSASMQSHRQGQDSHRGLMDELNVDYEIENPIDND